MGDPAAGDRSTEGQPEESAPADPSPDHLRQGSAETVGTGSVLGIGCLVGVVVLVIILAALFLVPLRR
ncbi:MAG TPA: hypothetical protein VER37_01105 [Thermomicrobiales bacterium]|nr:hypothetical protein [Thermomicrobiales bacterium]